MSVVHAMHAWLYLKRHQPLSIFVPPVSGLPLMVGRSTTPEVATRALTSLGVTDTALRQGNSQLITCFVCEIDLREIFECAHLKFTVYGRKQARTYVNTLPQCSPASVGLAQARPNEPSIALLAAWTIRS